MALAMKTPFKSYDRLKESGLSEFQARSVVEAIEESEAFNFNSLATKSDLLLTKTELQKEMTELRTELKTEIGELRIELKAEIDELRTELKTDIGELRTELRTDMATVKTKISGLESSIRSLQTIFVSGFLVILVGMVLSYFHP